jgi:sarcosine oxidase
MIGPEDSETIRNVLASADDFDIPHRVLDEASMARTYPQHRPLPGEIAVFDEWAGVLRPEFAVLAAATVARSRGARLVTGETITRLQPVAGGVRIHAGDRSWTVEQAVVTAGPWTNRFVPSLHDLVRPNKLVMTWYHPRGSVADYLPDAFPIFIRETRGAHIFGLPTLDGGSVKVAPHASYGEMRDADDLDRNVAAADLERINSLVADLLPGLVPTPVRVASYMDAYTPDAHGLVGAMPGIDNVWVLGGFSGHGFKMAPAFGRVATDLVTTGKTSLPIEHLDPARLLL